MGEYAPAVLKINIDEALVTFEKQGPRWSWDLRSRHVKMLNRNAAQASTIDITVRIILFNAFLCAVLNIHT